MNWKLAAAPLCAILITTGSGRTGGASTSTYVQSALEDRITTEVRQVRLVPAPDGNEARYLVREQLAALEFPSDAVGRTNAITGAIVIADDGSVVKEQSKLVIDLTTLKSDAQMRDRYIQRNTLQTAQFGTAELVLTGISGLRMPLPTSGQYTVQVTGNLTLRGVTKPTTWQATVQASPDAYTGTAKTAFTFADFELTKPRVARVLSVVDTIRLEYDFKLIHADSN